MYKKSLSKRGENYPLESRKRKNASYYYYILCRRHLNFFNSSTVESEGKKKNLLGSGKLQNQVGLSYNSVGITDFRKLLKDSKKQKTKKETNSNYSFPVRSKSLLDNLESSNLNISKGAEYMSKTFGFTQKSYVKPGNGTSFSEFNQGGFFPYRKSFLCYWLLPFVGFVSSATFSSNNHLTHESAFYLPNTFQTSDSKQNLEDLLGKKNLRDTDDLGPEYESNGFYPLKKQTIGLNKTEPPFLFNDKNSLFASTNKEGLGSFLSKNLNSVIARSNLEKKSNSFISSHVDNKNLKSENPNLYLDNSIAYELKNNIYNEDLGINTTSNSTKYCMLYLDCLENDLKFLEKGEVGKPLKRNLQTPSFVKSSFHPNPFSSLLLTEGKNHFNGVIDDILSVSAQERLEEKPNGFSSPLYPNSFFNRVLLSNNEFDKFMCEPLKLNLNVPDLFSVSEFGKIQNSKNFVTNKYSNVIFGKEKENVGLSFVNLKIPKEFLELRKLEDFKEPFRFFKTSTFEDSQKETSTRDLDSRQHEVVSPRLTTESGLRAVSRTRKKISDIVYEKSFSTLTKVLPQKTNKYKKNNPVSSYLRASTLLDKYMVYKPILQDFETKTNRVFPKNAVIRSISDTKNKKDYLSPSINVKPELVDKLFSYFAKETFYEPDPSFFWKEKRSSLNLSFKLPTNKLETSVQNLPSYMAGSTGLRTTKIFQKLGFLENKKGLNPELLVSKHVESGLSKQQNLVESKPKILNKVSKEKIYKIVLSTLKETWNQSSQFSETDNETSSSNKKLPIKFKHPILMSNKSAYPLLFSKNELISSRKNTGISVVQNTEKLEEIKKIYPSMLQNVSPVFKEKRPLENLRNSPTQFFLSTQNNVNTENFKNVDLNSAFFKKRGEILRGSKNGPVSDTNNILKTSDTKNKQKKLTNKYFQFKNYLKKFTGYALKDFLILNKISTYIKPISQENSIKKFNNLRASFPKQRESGLETEILSLDSNNFSKNLLMKHPYVLNNETKENVLKTNLDYPNENFMLTKESSLKKCKIRQNNKTAKLLRAYFSIKKSSNNKLYGLVQNNTPTSSNRLKQRILFNLLSKSYLQLSDKNLSNTVGIHTNSQHFPLSAPTLLIKETPSSLNENLSLTKELEFLNSLKEKNSLKFLSHQLLSNKRGKVGLLSNEEKKKNGIYIKDFSISPRLLINNRLFMKVNNLKKLTAVEDLQSKFSNKNQTVLSTPFLNTSNFQSLKVELLNSTENSASFEKNLGEFGSKYSSFASGENKNINEEVIRKRKTIQKKRRITKLKKETRRRKKRMRFYPRPVWLRYRFYAQFLKNRRQLKNSNLEKIFKKDLKNLRKINFKNLNYNLPKSYRYEEIFKNTKLRVYLNKHGESGLGGIGLATPQRVFMNPSANFPYSTGPSSINVSPSIMGEFKTAFWKSYWLRSNLKPYLKKIKTSLKEIKETPQFSSNVDSSFVQKDMVKSTERSEVTRRKEGTSIKHIHFLRNVRSFISSFLGLNTVNTMESSKDLSTSFNTYYPQAPLAKKDIESFYKTANYLAEYNEISSQRIQQFVSQIRENLTLNGNAKVRPSRITMNFGPKVSKKNGINFFKRPSLRYNAMARLRLYWAFSKGNTNLAGLGTNTLLPGAETVNGNNYNKRKQIWTTEKFRQQTKENKTKKLINDIKTKLKFFLNETPYISTESNIPLWNTLILKSMKKLRLQEEKFQNLAYVNIKTKNKNSNYSSNYSSNLRPKTSSLRQFNFRKNRLTNSFKRTAKVQPFISGKTNYWWTYGNNTPFSGVNSFLSTPTCYGTNLMQVYGSYRQDNIFNSQIKKGWASTSVKNTPSTIGLEWQLSSLQINTILFHFCSLITLLSISQIRGLLKFSFIGVNKIYSLLERLIPSNFYNNPLKPEQVSTNEFKFGYNVTADKRSDKNIHISEHLEKQNLLNLQNNKKISNWFFEETSSDSKNSKKFFEWVFDFEKQNNSFMYAFYVTNKKEKSAVNEENQKQSSFSPRLTIETQNKVMKDSNNLFIKPDPSCFFKETRSMVKNEILSQENSVMLFPFLSLTGFYFFLNYLVKKPIYLYYKWFDFSLKDKSLKNNKNQDETKGSSPTDKKVDLSKTMGSYEAQPDVMKEPNLEPSVKQKWNRATKIKNVSLLYSLLFIRFGFNSYTQISKNTSNLLGQRTKLESAFRSVYTFFEKPGILIVDWVAYLFLVEWASDITNTLPEKIDTQLVGSPFNKLTRTIYNIYPFLPWSQTLMKMNEFNFRGAVDYDLTSRVSFSGLTSKTTFLSLASTFLKRRIYHLYEILLLQFYQPDTDLLVRQKKGIVFWDIWGDFLTQTAEDSNINISELTSLKEEQMKLLENASQKISEYSSPVDIVKGNEYRLPSRGLPQRGNLHSEGTKGIYPLKTGKRDSMNNIYSNKEKIYSKVSSVTPIKFLLSKKANLRFSHNQTDLEKSKQTYRTDIISTLKPTTSNLGMPSKSLLGMPLQPRSQNLEGLYDQWGSQQFLSYAIKSKDTELFIDLHPPRALSSVLKNRETSQQLRAISPMGSLVCQIFAGILYKQISKNILIVGNVRNPEGARKSANENKKKSDNSSLLNETSASMEKTLLVQAIAGETELKIITDNAHRYALVYRGVAVGIKLLRDVFDSLSLQTPCFFLIEDIHAIGERRPFLISDDTPEGGQNTEIHEKNQVLYQLSKHVISHYKKPYKGDFSLSIPTNHFCFDFFKARTQNNSNIGKASIARQNTVSPKIRHNETPDGEQKSPRILPSRLLRPSTELLSPPATSPFSVLTLKEEKKFKTHKTVADLPWTGRIMHTPQGETTGSQDSQKTGPAYSIRAKVALLADIAISSLSVKLDMITDLLVIIDSVKGNRGFVVFATTHIPFVLDPALRRPGRLDETINFAFSSKSHSWEISHFSILNVPRPTYTSLGATATSPHNSKLDYNFFTPYSPWFSQETLSYNEPLKIFSSLPGFNTYASLGRKGGASLDFSLTSTGIDSNTILTRLCQKAIQTYPFSTTSSQTYLKRTSSLFHFFPNTLSFFKETSSVHQNLFHQNFKTNNKKSIKDYNLSPTSLRTRLPRLTTESTQNLSSFTQSSSTNNNCTNIFYKNIQITKILSQVATKASAYLNSSINLKSSLKDFETVSSSRVKEERHLDISINNALTQLPDLSLESILSNSSYLSMYSSPHFFKNNISLLISGKIGEYFLFSKKSQLEKNNRPFFDQTLRVNKHEDFSVRNSSRRGSTSSNFVQHCNSVSTTRRSSLMPVITESISSLVLSFIQKRFLYKRNLMLPSLFLLTNYSSLLEPPSPPISSILLPAKRYENLKRSLSYYQNHDQNFGSGFLEKINIHQQQRLVKRLYNIPVKESFKSEIIENRLSSFSNASLMIGSLSPSGLQKVSSSNWFLRNRIFTRHSHYLTNQWWTGQLPEHNAETTFLSDIDWRYTFVEREARDILLDFPDTDQHYNPRNRRWVGNHQTVSHSLGFNSNTMSLSDNSFYSEIYSHFIYDSFLKAFNIYEHNREVFDYYAFHICKQGLHCHLHEFERLKLIQRFLEVEQR